MKNSLSKTIISAAIGLVAMPAFAGGTGGNEIYITQTNANSIEVSQDCGPTGCNNIGSITQVSDGTHPNSAKLVQINANNQGHITQSGKSNYTLVEQRNNARADARQLNQESSYIRINQNRDDIDPSIIAGSNNIASAYQTDGNLQVALIKQFGDNGEAHTRQRGDSNQIKIIQNQGSIGEYAYATQDGWSNTADIIMNGRGDDVVTGQSGMKQNLDIDVAVSSRESNIRAYQTGSFNNAKAYTQGVENDIYINQNNTKNYAEVTQLGNHQSASIIQDGVENNAVIGQYEGAVGSHAAIAQYGTKHVAAIYQTCPTSTASITQYGTGATAIIHQ
jgi:hypothetical protein